MSWFDKLTRNGHGRRAHRGRRPLTMIASRVIATALAVVAIGAGSFSAAPAFAAPVYQIKANWADGTAAQVASGDVVSSEWRVNVNDDAAVPSNDPVDNVTFTATVANGTIASIPDSCLTTGVSPISAISADGLTLTCNIGTQDQGTAVAVVVPVTVDGATGDAISMTGQIEGQNASVPDIPIQNPFNMDMAWGNPAAGSTLISAGVYEASYQWTLNLKDRSEAGPDSVSYTITVAADNGSAVTAAPSGCSPFTTGAAGGHPWSGGGNPADQTAPFVGTCTLTPTGTAGQFTLTLTGIDYSLTQDPTTDSAGHALPTGWSAVASGQVTFRIATTGNTGLGLASNAPTYTAPGSKATVVDDASNNTSSKAINVVGGSNNAWNRAYTGAGGDPWDDSYRVSAGTNVRQAISLDSRPYGGGPTATFGVCTIIDSRYVTLTVAIPAGVDPALYPVQYYVGTSAVVDPNSASYDPNAFDCGTGGNASTGGGGWVTTPPADLSTVKALRLTYPKSEADRDQAREGITANVKIKDTAPVGQDVWTWGEILRGDSVWTSPTGGIDRTATPDARYPVTTGYRDILRIITATPDVVKSVDRSVVSPGVPANYTLTYSANGAGAIPATVDNYQLVDTLPVGLTYVDGSATPAPTVTTDGSGQQVLTWTLNGVPTNQQIPLTYQAVAADTVTPGAALTNSATATFGGQSATSTAQVTVSTNGYTTIAKTADAQFIPNVNGDGKGSGSWTVALRSYDPLEQAYTDTIDILPYVGDGRGTAFSGSYTIKPVTAAAGGTVYYSTADPATLSDDPGDGSNGAPGAVTGNTVGWSTTFTANATAVRVIGDTLAPGATQTFKVPVTTDGVKGGDVLVNRAQARDGHTQLVMRTSAPISVANYYSATVKKEVQASDGTWHDANDASDYPVFHYGDTVKYRVIVTNTGQGTLTNVDITDDKNPTDGAFHIDSLDPGESQTHEYSFVLDETTGGSIVNTACGTADTPADSGVAPTIPCDPAGIEAVGYSVVKTSDPATGSTVKPGQVIHYTITVTQRGTVAADAELHDALAGVTDDATFNNDLAADLGTATLNGDTIDWTGTVPVGGVAKITYSVKVNDSASLGNSLLDNVVSSDGCNPLSDCVTHHDVGSYTYSKTSNPASGTDVKVGSTIVYTVQVKQVGAVAQKDVAIEDSLTDVLDDATWVGDEVADSGTVKRDGDTLNWSGDLAVGQVVTITYSVKVTGAGDTTLTNQVTSDDGTCVPAADQNPDCTTVHHTGNFTYSKMANPASPATVKIGDKVTYTVTATQTGTGAVPGASLVDDLSGVLDDATWVGDEHADSGTVALDGSKLTWTGDLAVGQVVTITYSVMVAGHGDTTLDNKVAPPPGSELGTCVPAPDETPNCATIHKYGGYTFSKTSNPATHSTVKAGDRIDYTVTVTQTGAAATKGTIVDDLSKVLDDAAWVGNEKASSGKVVRDGNSLTWNGDLAIGQVVTITYSVTVNANGDGKIANVVTSPDGDATCVPAADQNPNCKTNHTVDPPAAALATTGSSIAGWLLLGLGMIAAGLVASIVRRRRRRNT